MFLLHVMMLLIQGGIRDFLPRRCRCDWQRAIGARYLRQNWKRLAFAYRNKTYIFREREIPAFDWSKFQSDWHNGWETDLEEKRAKFLSPNSLRQLWTNVYQITSSEKMDFPAFEWNQFQIHTTNIWDALLGNVSRTDQWMCEISTSDAIMVAIKGAADLPQTSNSICSPNRWVSFTG